MMKKIVFLFVFLLIFVGLGFFVYLKSTKSQQIQSPLPNFLKKSDNSEVSSLDFWVPQLLGFFNLDSETPLVTAKSVLVYDLKNEEDHQLELWQNTLADVEKKVDFISHSLSEPEDV